MRAHWAHHLEALFRDEVDVLATPATGVAAPPVAASAQAMDLETTEQMMRFSLLANLVGVPAISFPAGQLADGRPVGLMLTAEWWEEHAELYDRFLKERARPWGLPLAQPLDRCISHFLGMLIRQIEGVQGGDSKLSEKELRSWMKATMRSR